MGCGLSTPMIAEDGSTAPQAAPSSAPGIDESGGSRNPHKRSKSQVSFKELSETEPLMGEEGRKSVSGRLESVEDVAMDVKEVVENVKEGSGETAVVAEKREEKKEGEEERDGSEIGPGSPSFREYCVHPTTNSVNLEDFTSSKSFEPKKGEKHRRRHSIATTEGSNAMLLKKEHKSGRFKWVIPKGGQAAVKNILNVTGCYCTNPHSHHHLEPTTSA